MTVLRPVRLPLFADSLVPHIFSHLSKQCSVRHACLLKLSGTLVMSNGSGRPVAY